MQGKYTIPKNTKQNSQNTKTKTSHQTAERSLSLCLSLSSSCSSWRWWPSSYASVSTGCLGFVCDVISRSLWWVSSASVNDVLIPRIVTESSCTFVLGFGALLLLLLLQFLFYLDKVEATYVDFLLAVYVSELDWAIYQPRETMIMLWWWNRICFHDTKESASGVSAWAWKKEAIIITTQGLNLGFSCLFVYLQQLREMFYMILWVSLFASCKRKL